jgi:hypothetical protein
MIEITKIDKTDDTSDCEEMLQIRNNCILSKNEFNANKDCDRYLDSNKNNKLFLYSIVFYFNSKLSETKLTEMETDSEFLLAVKNLKTLNLYF